jgi:hypothetical protein
MNACPQFWADDGLMMKSAEGADAPTRMVLVLNWFDELRRLAATTR